VIEKEVVCDWNYFINFKQINCENGGGGGKGRHFPSLVYAMVHATSGICSSLSLGIPSVYAADLESISTYFCHFVLETVETIGTGGEIEKGESEEDS